MIKRIIGIAETCEFWQVGPDVYRCSLPVTLDIYGLPSARRWECSVAHFEQYRDVYRSWVTWVEPGPLLAGDKP